MVGVKFLFVIFAVMNVARGNPTAVDVLQDIYQNCLKYFSVSCVKPKAFEWIKSVADKPVIKITEDLDIVKKTDRYEVEEQRSATKDILDKFEDFLQNHDIIARVPSLLRVDGPLGKLVPRSFQPSDVSLPLAATGRSKLVKKVIAPFLLGLKFKTAVLVPLALALIALKTWKALTLGLLSLVLTGALMIFKLSKPKVVNYEVIHYPQHIEHHVEHQPAPAAAPAGWDHPGYGREISGAQEIAYNAYAK